MKVNLFEPILEGNEKKYLNQCIDEGWVSGGGRFVDEFEEKFAEYMGADYAVAVNSGIGALETMIWAYKPNYLAMTNSTIISCPIATHRAGCIPSFNDIELIEGCMKGSSWRSALLVHSFGNYCIKPENVDFYLEDRSQYWTKSHVETAAAYSLYTNKLITAGEGGVVITNDRKIYEKMRSYRDLCHSKERFVHYDMGYNFRMSNMQAAVALAQLEQIDKFICKRRVNAKRLALRLPKGVYFINGGADIPWMHLVETKIPAKQAVEYLHNKGIECRRFFSPLNRQRAFKSSGSFPNSEKAWKYWFYLPSSPGLKMKEIEWIVKSLESMVSTTMKSTKTNGTKKKQKKPTSGPTDLKEYSTSAAEPENIYLSWRTMP